MLLKNILTDTVLVTFIDGNGEILKHHQTSTFFPKKKWVSQIGSGYPL